MTRDGTELTEAADKIAQVRRLLVRGEAELWFDPETNSCNIVLRGPATDSLGKSERGSSPGRG